MSDLLDFTNVMRYRSEMSKMVILERIFKNQKIACNTKKFAQLYWNTQMMQILGLDQPLLL